MREWIEKNVFELQTEAAVEQKSIKFQLTQKHRVKKNEKKSWKWMRKKLNVKWFDSVAIGQNLIV